MRKKPVIGTIGFGVLLFSAVGRTAVQDPVSQDSTVSNDPTAVSIAAPAQHEAPYRPMTAKERWAAYMGESVFSLRLGVGTLLSAAIAHANREPREWGTGAGGYFHRVENRWAVTALQGSLHSAGAAALGHDTRYRRMPDATGIHRAGHALWRTLFTYDREGRPTPDVTNLASLYAAPMIGTMWNPRRYGPLHQGIHAGEFGVMTQAGTNLLKEFGPDLRRVFKR